MASDGEFDKRSKYRNFEAMQNAIYATSKTMMYLPRLCEHCLNPSCVASCPSGSIYKREEGGIVLIDQLKCRRWRRVRLYTQSERWPTFPRA